MTDFNISNQGSIIIVTPVSPAADEWLVENVDLDNPELQRWGTGIVVEPRHADALVEGMAHAGLTYD